MNIGAFAGGIGIWSFLEYATHRFLLHGPLLRLHLPHHAKPTGQAFDWKPSIIAGVLAGYVVYSYVHCKLHEGSKFGKLKDWHDIHHELPDRNFGVTTLFWDRVFRTFVDGIFHKESTADPHLRDKISRSTAAA